MNPDELPEESELTPETDPAEVTAEQLLGEPLTTKEDTAGLALKAVVEGIVYITDEPLTARQIANGLDQPVEKVRAILEELVADYSSPAHGIGVREVAEGFKMGTKPEHHEAIRAFVKSLTPPLKLSMAALETLAVIAYKQPITGPEILEIRGVQGGSVLKTLLERKLITAAGRKSVVGRPILYKTTKEFLVQFGLRDLSELPTLKEFEELARLAFGGSDAEAPAAPKAPQSETAPAASSSENDARKAVTES